MKIIATGDWHLGNIFHTIDRTEEHRHFLGWLLEQMEAHRPAAVLVAGDVFDNGNPSAEAQKTYYRFLAEAGRRCPDTKIIITSGNHDSASRLEAPRPMLECNNVEVRGVIRRRRVIKEDGHTNIETDYDDLIIPLGAEAVVLAVPYLRYDIVHGNSYSEGVMTFLREFTEKARQKHPGKKLIMMAHMYAKGAEIAEHDRSERIIGGQEEVTMGNWPDHPDYLTCGHIHKRQHIWNTDWARYAGSVLPMSFTEKDYKHGVDLVEIDAEGNLSVEKLVYTPQHRLVVIPNDKDGATPAEIKKLIKSTLRDKATDSDTDDADYVALKIIMEKDDPDVTKKLAELVGSKNAVMCHFDRKLPGINNTAIGTDEEFTSIEDINRRDPLETLKEAFLVEYKFKKEMSERQINMIKELFTQINLGNKQQS